MNEYIPVVVALIASPLVAWITVRASRPKVKADASETLTAISLSLLEPLQERIEELERHAEVNEDRIAKLEKENRALHRWAQILHAQVIEAGGEPIQFDAIKKLGE